jgi:2-keto-3-deoxy-L-rhamnonate aldolase RhmA
MIRAHRLRQKLADGQPTMGMLVNFRSEWFVDMIALMGFDFVLLDAEHGPLDPASAEHMIRAAEGAGISAIVRVPNVPHEIQRFLDIGASGIQTPHIDNADDARAAVDAMRYPPLGNRGLATVTRAAGYGVDTTPREYMDTANHEVLCLPVIETAQGLANVEAIAATEGIDAVVIGTGDLSTSMGHSGNRKHPEVLAAVTHITARAKHHRKWVGVPAYDAETARLGLAAGADMVQVPPPAVLARAGREFIRHALSLNP